MSNINLNLYKIFCKVAQSKSYSEAAEKLTLSVPNISMQIANLEEQLNLKLFNREKKGITLTEDGKALYEIVNKSISSFDFAEKMAKDKNNISCGNIKIACPSHLATYFLIEKVEKVKRDYPNLKISITCELDENKMVELLQDHKIDFAITDVLINENKVEIEELVTINNIFVSKTPLTISDKKEIESLNCILNLENTRTNKKLKETLQKYDVNIKSNLICDATELRVEAVKRNMGIAYVIREAVKKELDNKELYEVKLPIQLPTVKLNLIYLENELTKVDKKFIDEYLKK